MLKMFATQLNGLFNRIQENQLESIEDGARLLSQGAIAEGTIYVYGANEMAAVSHEATLGSEPLSFCSTMHHDESLDHLENRDRVLLITRYSSDPEALQLAKKLFEKRPQGSNRQQTSQEDCPSANPRTTTMNSRPNLSKARSRLVSSVARPFSHPAAACDCCTI